MSNINLEFWLLEQEAAAQGAPAQQAPPATPPNPGDTGASVTSPTQEDPQAIGKEEEEAPDTLADPQHPDMDGLNDDSADFEAWRKEYFDLAIKGDSNEMLDALNQVRDRKLNAAQRRFVEDNLQVVLLRQDANFDRASKEIRRLINQELDRNNPAVSLMEHINNTLQAYPVINNIFLKLAGQGGLKGDLHRKVVAALLGAVETGGGGTRQDLIFVARDYSIDISTRFYTKWGDITIGRWMLEEEDPEQILSDSELERLQDGSPEEKRVLRRRVCLESIANKYAARAFIIHVVTPEDGTIHAMGWDISEGLKTGYKEGKLIVRKKKSSVRNAMIDDNGAIIPLIGYTISYHKDSDELSSSGGSSKDEIAFMEQRDSTLYLTAEPDTIQEIAGGMPGISFSSQPYQGNPSDITTIMRCFPSTTEMLMRRC